MRAAMLPDFDPGPIDRLIMNGHRTHVLPQEAELLRPFAQIELSAWCVRRSRYLVPTSELIGWLTEQIGGRHAIEIGAGMGDLGRALMIPMTDSYIQTSPALRDYYALLGQPIVSPPESVIRLEALDAVAKFKPRVVIGAWITQLYRDGDAEGSAFGVDEETIIEQVETYIHIGNLDVHGSKRILRTRHEARALPFIFSRGFDRTRNIVHIWNR